MIHHHFTVDVEEYFQVSALETAAPRARWSTFESRIVASVESLLELLAAAAARGTFFVLGWVAKRHPHLIRTIAWSGHEIASHGWDHRRITEQDRDDFRASIRNSRLLLEDLTGQGVEGFRAPSFSIIPGKEWTFDILLEEGYRYDSSLFPVRRRNYGYPNAFRDPHWVLRPGGRLAELPPATLQYMGINVPAGGGGYFRLLPYTLVSSALADCERRGVPGTFYIHPWELDPDQPRMDVPWLTQWRHYGGIGATRARLARLLREFKFTTAAETLATM